MKLKFFNCAVLFLFFPIVTFADSASAKKVPTLIIIGDSLTEGYGIPKAKAYPSLVEEKFAAGNIPLKIINSGVSGSTSASAPARVTWALKTRPEYLVIALGANDGLRGLSATAMKKNLSRAIDLALEAKVKVILFGMLMPPNFGKKYTTDFEKAFKDLATEKKIPFLPFPLKDVGGVKDLNQGDGIHPNEKGHAIMANTIYGFLKEHVK